MIDQKYQLCKKLGRGGSSEVYKASDEFENQFAIKIIRKPYQMQETYTSIWELQKEHLIMEMVKDHPNVLKCYSFVYEGFFVYNEQNSRIKYSILELANNGTLSSLVRKMGFLEEQHVRFYSNQIVSAIAYIHSKGIAHCDIKPQNILLDDNYNAKIADFGAWEIDIKGDGLWNRRKGTPKYMPPEIEDFTLSKYSKSPYFNMYSADIFSLGVTIFFLLTGKTPSCFRNLESEKTTESSQDHQHSSRNIGDKSGSIEDTLFKHLISDELIDLLKSMLDPIPECRPTISEVMDHPWFSLEYLNTSPEEVYSNVCQE